MWGKFFDARFTRKDYNPNQPRAPKGTPEGGQWVSDVGAGASNKIDTPAFKKWFGESKVVNEIGEPLIVYHESKSEMPFSVFDPDEIGNRATFLDAYYFSNNKTWGGNSALPVYLKLEHPIVIDISESSLTTRDLQELIDDARRGAENFVSRWSARRGIRVEEIDGYIAYNPEWATRAGTIEYAVLKDAHQKGSKVKSAHNNGAWNKDNQDIYE